MLTQQPLDKHTVCVRYNDTNFFLQKTLPVSDYRDVMETDEGLYK